MPPKGRSKNVLAHASNLTLAPRIQDVPPDMLEKMFYSTTAKRASVNHFQAHPEAARNARPESFKGVSISTPKWEPSTAPTATRADCSYHSQFVRLPLDAAPVTRELGQLLGKDAFRGQGGGSSGAGLPLSTVTTSKSAYVSYNRGYKQLESYKPAVGTHVNPNNKFMESKTAFQRQFPEYKEADVRRSRAEMVNPRQGVLRGAVAPLDSMTAYRRDFNRGSGAGRVGMQPSSTAPSLR
eukprot:TRINITY_DN21802_c0_g1_i2.p1 TRINITY_DN21802_c0_g1~~TRINITY_DN21802_c0_g1_i2.p1  ORF type:complete len:239 (-),score=36.41 TRINITY_DN21802_c0_g1_i2:249-965(-)